MPKSHRRRVAKDYEFSMQDINAQKERLNQRCERCVKQFKINQLYAHHITSVSEALDNPSLSAAMISDISNMSILCKNCHDKKDREQKTQEQQAKKVKWWW